MGTRFIATKEAPVHDNVKRALLNATEFDTRLVMRNLRNTERVLTNKGVERLIEIEQEKGKSIKIDDILEEVAGVYPKVMIEGNMDAGAWSCGMVVGLINDIPTCKELIDRIMADAEFIIRKRLTGFPRWHLFSKRAAQEGGVSFSSFRGARACERTRGIQKGLLWIPDQSAARTVRNDVLGTGKVRPPSLQGALATKQSGLFLLLWIASLRSQ